MITLRQFAESIVNDEAYRDTVRARAQAGLLPPDVELFLLEIVELADGRALSARAESVRAPTQSATLALVRRPSATVAEEEQA